MSSVETSIKPQGAVKRFLKRLGLLLCLGIIGAIAWYILSELNYRQFRLIAVDRQLQVEKGLFLPTGFKPYEPRAQTLRAAYAPIPIPSGEPAPPTEYYQDRLELDRSLFSLLATWAQKRLSSSDTQEFDRASGYIERLQLLPGLSEEQRKELQKLRANIALQKGHELLKNALSRLEDARLEFQLAAKLGGNQAPDAVKKIHELSECLKNEPEEETAENLSSGTTPH